MEEALTDSLQGNHAPTNILFLNLDLNHALSAAVPVFIEFNNNMLQNLTDSLHGVSALRQAHQISRLAGRSESWPVAGSHYRTAPWHYHPRMTLLLLGALSFSFVHVFFFYYYSLAARESHGQSS